MAELTLAEHKIEAMTLTVGVHTFITQTTIRHLGVFLDTKLSFKPRIEYVAKIASGISKILACLILNVVNKTESKRTKATETGDSNNSVWYYMRKG